MSNGKEVLIAAKFDTSVKAARPDKLLQQLQMQFGGIEFRLIDAPQEAVDIDSCALELMQKVWAIGNRHGPDSQRKAQIQCCIADFLKAYTLPDAARGLLVELDALPIDSKGGHCD